MLLGQQVEHHEADEMVNFYKANFAYVAVVYCSKCENPIAILVRDPMAGDWMGLRPNEAGVAVVPVGSALLSSRARLDLTPAGERMLGFHCGFQLPNPEYEPAMAKWKAEVAKYTKTHEKALEDAAMSFKEQQAAYDKEHLEGTPPPQCQEPEFNPPAKPAIAGFVFCNNRTILAEPEMNIVPGTNAPVAPGSDQVNYANPFEKHKIMESIKANKSYKPDFEEHAHIRRYETFRVEQV